MNRRTAIYHITPCAVLSSTVPGIKTLRIYGRVGVRDKWQKMGQLPESQSVSKTQPEKPRLLDQVRANIRTKHYSPRTEKTYVHWIKRFIYFTGKRHPRELGAAIVQLLFCKFAQGDLILEG